MINRLNKNLLKQQQVADEDTKDLLALHFAMDAIINHQDEYCRSDLTKVIERLEYMMQDKWGFSRVRERHTHVARIRYRQGTR